MSNSTPWSGQLSVATTDGLSLLVRTGGAPEGPTVILVHGYPDNHAVWDQVAADLGQTMRVVAYDTRGAGGSEAPPGRDGFKIEQLGSDLRAVAEAVSPDHPVHLVAHDWGSVQAWEAITEPGAEDRFASFTSISGPCIDHLAHATRRQLRSKPTAALMQAARSWYVAMFHVPKLPEVFLRKGIARRFAPESTGSTSDAVNCIEIYRANVGRLMRHPRQRHTRVPVQVLIATHDRYVGADAFDGLEQWTDTLATAHVEGGHWLPRTNAAEVAAAAKSFALSAGGARV